MKRAQGIKFLILFLLIGATIGSTVLIQQKVHLESFASDETVTCDKSPTPAFGDRSKRATIQPDQTQSLKASLQQYQSASHEQRLAEHNQLKQLAQQRKDALILLMRQNPKEALSAISSLDPDGVISQVTKNCVPTESTVIGTLDITHADYPNGTSITELAVLSPTHERVIVNTVAGFSTQLESGIPVRTHGLRLDNDLLVNEPASTSVVQTTATTPTPTPALATEAATTLVHKRVAIVMANFTDTNNFDTTMATVNDQVFNTINHYY